MVKLRSRLIRSPFSGGATESSSANNNGGREPYNQRQTNHHHRRRMSDNNTANPQQQQQQHLRSRAREPNNQSTTSTNNNHHHPRVSSSLERRPFRSRSPFRRSSNTNLHLRSPNGKRKPESRGITASIRRAKSAMFRMASSPVMNSSASNHDNNSSTNGNNIGGLGGNHNEDIVASRRATTPSSNNNNIVNDDDDDDDDEQMDMGEDTNPTNGAVALPSGGGAVTLEIPLAIHRTPSQEENVPPMALLSPNCGTFYAHAAGKSAASAAAAASASASSFRGSGGSIPFHDENHSRRMIKKGGGVGVDDAMEIESSTLEAEVASAVPSSKAKNDVTTTPKVKKKVLEWMKEDAPPELLPKLLSFCGSRRMATLSRVNKAWNGVMKDESVWRVLCEDTHKWTDGDEIPRQWSQFYKQNPIVPIDYDTVDAAFEAISSGPRTDTIENNVLHSYREQRKTCRILLHPGPYFLRRPLVANVAGTEELTIECVRGATDPEHGITWQRNYHKQALMEMERSSDTNGSAAAAPAFLSAAHAHFESAETRRPSSPTLRQIFGSCGGRSSSGSSALDSSVASSRHSSSSSSSDESGNSFLTTDQSKHREAFHKSCFQGPNPSPLLCLESQNQNEPCVRIRRGIVNLRGIKLLHYCEGTDIWNGNAALQVQSAFGRNGRPLRVVPPSVVPTANVVDCDITSLSGRGLVNIDGAVSNVHDCNFHDSAATGVYVGGSGSVATLTQTDVVANGIGNVRNARHGVARGHSGVYVEQGLATLRDCNISRNTLTGISAISTDQARLHIEGSDVQGNRSDQMELPPADSGRGVSRNNRISSSGKGRARSKHLRDTEVMQIEDRRTMPPTPQSPLEYEEDL